MNTIKVDDLEELLKRLIQRFRDRNISEIKIDADWYWRVNPDQMTRFSEQPDLHVGSVNDDLQFLQSTIDENWNPGFLDLARLAGVLQITSIVTESW